MARWVSKGKCNLCGQVFSKSGMSRHLLKCRQAHALGKLGGRGKLHKTDLLHLAVEGARSPDHWLHLEVPADATLGDLDQFLRDIWLECCGHLSAFTIENTRYELDTGGIDAMWPMFFGRASPPKSMQIPLGSVLQPKLKFHHEYDFGTTTELTLKVVSEYEGEAKGKSVQILARNDPPPYVCESCGKPATLVCVECIWQGEGFVCDECAPDHSCGDEMMLPVVNSPRMGMCGYTGPEAD
jgi:Plasmid pRiA4b ORF-3-like protein